MDKARFTFLCLISGILWSCGELETPSFNQYVVEAFITADESVNDIKIKETSALDDDSLLNVAPIDNATVSISIGQELTPLDFDITTGKYTEPTGKLIVEVGQTYNLEVTVDGLTASANTVVPERPTGLELTDSVLTIPTLVLNFTLRDQIQDLFENEVISLTWDPVAGRSYFVVIETQESELDPILPEEIPAQSVELLQSFRFISAPSTASSFDIIGIALETYGRHVAKVYSVNQEYVDLFNSSTQDSRDLNEPPSNITNALGIFSAFAVDSLEFEVRRN